MLWPLKCLLHKIPSFKLPHATTQDMNKFINSLRSGKDTGPDGIPVKFMNCLQM